MRLARRWRSVGTAGTGHGLSPHQERGLLALARLARRTQQDGSAEHSRHGERLPSPGVRISHLADHLGIAPRSATEVADALESARLLTRSPDPTDRRAVLLRLTDEGWRAVAAARDRRRAAADEAVAALAPADRAELRRLLETLLQT
ncbi:MarR family transcriptional regulator [Ornithinimicrobium avium]|uniref:MarR family transcriptional regulator n=2 Tax=Ornithinimicrobium avium TaxID=2283195 RepID=A0A345NSZ3_9MICO|nr:MarR family transcriptional regulator [Ornithinimicrobium avium]